MLTSHEGQKRTHTGTGLASGAVKRAMVGTRLDEKDLEHALPTFGDELTTLGRDMYIVS
jgi:hypothetical protein